MCLIHLEFGLNYVWDCCNFCVRVFSPVPEGTTGRKAGIFSCTDFAFFVKKFFTLRWA